MTATTPPLPALRPELVVRPVGDDGQCVVKDASKGEYFEFGPQEHYLLTRLDGFHDAATVCAAFEGRFDQALSEDELNEFVESLREQGLLLASEGSTWAESESPPRGASGGKNRPNLLHWRVRAFDPDRLFTRMEPRLRFFWTGRFLTFSAGCIALAALVVWANREQVAGNFIDALRWETAVWAWLTISVVTLLHEFAHGLTCKHYGGEVHEVGFLCVLFVPCFYCNVSDAWLFKEKSKRLWVTFAGGYFELFLWALAVFAWRLTLPGTFPNYLAFVVVTACGVQTLFNFNPLLKFDGYYLLSDWKGVPNLKQRADDYAKGLVRRLLWGVPRPEREPRGGFLAAYGLASVLFALGFLAASLAVVGHLAGELLGWVGFGAVGVLGVLSLRGLLKGFTAGEVGRMILTRHKRTAVWMALIGAAGLALTVIDIRDRAGGSFQARAVTRAEVRAPASGFIREVGYDEGDRVSPGATLLRLEVPDLASRLAQKRAEIHQVEARLHLLGEEVAEQRRKVTRAEGWRDLAKEDLARDERALAEELTRLDEQITQARAEADAARSSRARVREAAAGGVGSREQVEDAERRFRVAEAQLTQAQADRRGREVRGVAECRRELDRRERELTEARAALAVLEGGTRSKEIEAERARRDGLRAEERHLLDVQARLVVCSPAPGVVTTPRLKEKIGQYVREGDLICVVEDPDTLEAEITLAEQDVARVRAGQSVRLKVRALPHETFAARVDRVAPAAAKGEGQNTVTVYCRVPDGAGLRPGMAGHARVYGEDRSVGGFLIDRAIRYLRTEFWW